MCGVEMEKMLFCSRNIIGYASIRPRDISVASSQCNIAAASAMWSRLCCSRREPVHFRRSKLVRLASAVGYSSNTHIALTSSAKNEI